MGVMKEFREFAMRGNVLDLAVAVVIGAAFGKIVSSLVGDIIMPAVGVLVGGVDLSKYKYVVKPAQDSQEEVAIRFGNFGQSIIDFLIIALAIFIVVKLINTAKRRFERVPPGAPVIPEDVLLLREIRDELRKR